MPTKGTQRGDFLKMSGLRSRRKGAGFERDAVALFRAIYGDGVRRGYQARDGSEAPDVEGTPYWVECKRGKKPNPRAALVQAQEATDGRTCLVIGRDDRGESWAFMRAADLLEILAEIRALKSPQPGDFSPFGGESGTGDGVDRAGSEGGGDRGDIGQGGSGTAGGGDEIKNGPRLQAAGRNGAESLDLRGKHGRLPRKFYSTEIRD